MSAPEIGDVSARGAADRVGVGVLDGTGTVDYNPPPVIIEPIPMTALTGWAALVAGKRPLPAGPDTVVYESGNRHTTTVQGAR